MEKYEEMLQSLDEKNRRIVLDAMECHDTHYHIMVAWTKRNYVKWQKIYSVMAGIYLGVKDYEDLYKALTKVTWKEGRRSGVSSLNTYLVIPHGQR